MFHGSLSNSLQQVGAVSKLTTVDLLSQHLNRAIIIHSGLVWDRSCYDSYDKSWSSVINLAVNRPSNSPYWGNRKRDTSDEDQNT